VGSFERISHHRLLDILREKIQDERLINLIRKFLEAGYLENWVYHKTYSGTPQGSVVSPILTNIYLDKLDRKLAEICQRYSQGRSRRHNPAHIRLTLCDYNGETTPCRNLVSRAKEEGTCLIHQTASQLSKSLKRRYSTG
jgi:retron-type reverse transcriptase